MSHLDLCALRPWPGVRWAGLPEQRAEEGDDAAVVKLGGLRQEPGTQRDIDERDHPRARADRSGVRERGLLVRHADTRPLIHQVVQRQLDQLSRGTLNRLQDDVLPVLLPSDRCPAGFHFGLGLQPAPREAASSLGAGRQPLGLVSLVCASHRRSIF